MIEIKTFTLEDSALYRLVLEIRQRVFVDEQHVPSVLEVENEESSTFYLLFQDDSPVATGRWRKTDNGIKLERFAVLPDYRNQHLGSVLLKRVLNDLENSGKTIYLNSQIKAVSFYERQGFHKIGEMFEEAGIQHYKMSFLKEKGS